MAPTRILLRTTRPLFHPRSSTLRSFSLTYHPRNEFEALNKRTNDTSATYRRYQIEKPLTPHFTNTTSTIANPLPSVGADAAPPELLKNVDSKGEFTPRDSVPENTERMTGGTQSGGGKAAGVKAGSTKGAGGKQTEKADAKGELSVGELEGATFKVEPLRRSGEDANTMRARLLYQSRKRGTLESDLLLSTFADAHLSTMPPALLAQYDLFLDENDWDIYYWATQSPSPTPTSAETAEGSGTTLATPNAQGKEKGVPAKDERTREPASGEWAQTVGTFKPAYRPVPTRWRGSEILALLRRHVKERSAGGVAEAGVGASAGADGEEEGRAKNAGKGLGMMPEIRNFDQA